MLTPSQLHQLSSLSTPDDLREFYSSLPSETLIHLMMGLSESHSSLLQIIVTFLHKENDLINSSAENFGKLLRNLQDAIKDIETSKAVVGLTYSLSEMRSIWVTLIDYLASTGIDIAVKRNEEDSSNLH